jgi:hypothetical protein
MTFFSLLAAVGILVAFVVGVLLGFRVGFVVGVNAVDRPSRAEIPSRAGGGDWEWPSGVRRPTVWKREQE